MLSVVTVNLFSVYRRGGGLKYSYRRRMNRCLSKQYFNSSCQGLRTSHEIADIEILGHKASYMEQAETIAGKAGVNLKIILKYILTNVKERKARTFVMLLSIQLSAMLLFVSFSIGVSYESAQRKMARGMAGSATVSVQSMEGGIHADDIPALPDIQTKAGIVEGTSLYHENGYYETVDLLAADMEAFNQINKPRLIGDGEVSAFFGNQIILPDRFTSKYDIEKGDTVTLQINGSPVDFEVAEIAAGEFCDNLYQRCISWRRASGFCRRTHEAGICGTGKRDGRSRKSITSLCI